MERKTLTLKRQTIEKRSESTEPIIQRRRKQVVVNTQRKPTKTTPTQLSKKVPPACEKKDAVVIPLENKLFRLRFQNNKRILPQQPYLSRMIRNAISLALGYKSYSDLVDSARRNMATSNDTEGNLFAFKEHEDAVWLSMYHLAEKLWPHEKLVGVTELDDLHSILANDFFQDGHSMAYSLTLKNMEISADPA